MVRPTVETWGPSINLGEHRVLGALSARVYASHDGSNKTVAPVISDASVNSNVLQPDPEGRMQIISMLLIINA